MNPLYQYLNYREFISDFYKHKKSGRRGFSYRKFAAEAGFRSPVFIKLVIDGKSNLSDSSARQLANAMELSSEECNFFCALVNFNQAKTFAQKEVWLSQLRCITEKTDSVLLNVEQYDYYSEWYISVLRELAARMPDADADNMAKMITPPISIAQAKKALALLLKIKLLDKDPLGAWRQCSQNVSTGNEVQSLAVRNHHKNMAALATWALDTIPSSERDVSGLTLSVSPEGYKKITKEIADLRAKITFIANQDIKSNQIFRLNLQLFPVSKKISSSEAENTDTPGESHE